MNTKKILLLIAFSAVVVSLVYFAQGSVSATSCPVNTIAGETQATLVGEVTNHGGDPNLEVWFQYGTTASYGQETPHSFMQGIGSFCATIYNLTPCTTYHYRAAASNSSGASYGGNQTFITQCSPVSVDIKANNSNGPINVPYMSNVVISWTSENAASCQASGDWSGAKSVSGSQAIQINQVKNYVFTLTCQGTSGAQTGSDSVAVNATPNLPVVITKPAVVTY